MSFRRVVLPQPLGPSTTIVWPSGTRRDKSWIATVDLGLRPTSRRPRLAQRLADIAQINPCHGHSSAGPVQLRDAQEGNMAFSLSGAASAHTLAA